MGLLKEYLQKELSLFVDNNVRFRPIGRLGDLDPDIQSGLARVVDATRECTGLLFQVALNYSGRADLVDVIRGAARAAQRKQLDPKDIDEAWITSHLATAGAADPDLLIRTSGELRVSNFLLWQLAYTELHFTPVLWPDFATRDLLTAMDDYAHRERRFGGVLPASGTSDEVEG